MLTLFSVVSALIGIVLMGAVLIQNPKGGGVDSTFGGAQANQMFGAARSTDFIEKATWYLAVTIFILCIASTLFLGDGAAVTAPLVGE